MNSSHRQPETSRPLPDFSTPVVMGILNLTPDSFFDGGRYNSVETALAKAEEMLHYGAGIIDIGAMSTRPFSQEISLTEEWGRLEEVLPTVRKEFPRALLSVDTYRSEIARRSVDCGADIINDISGGLFDDKMIAEIARLRVPYIIMHTLGKPQDMQQNPFYDDVVKAVDSFFTSQIKALTSLWADAKIILDPGFGFGKTVNHNYILLRNLDKFKYHGFPLLAGLSRKSMINRVLGIQPGEALNGTTALNMLAMVNGAGILRVHDVKEAVQAVKLFEAWQQAAT
jgi:dihydropteroate synthase